MNPFFSGEGMENSADHIKSKRPLPISPMSTKFLIKIKSAVQQIYFNLNRLLKGYFI